MRLVTKKLFRKTVYRSSVEEGKKLINRGFNAFDYNLINWIEYFVICT